MLNLDIFCFWAVGWTTKTLEDIILSSEKSQWVNFLLLSCLVTENLTTIILTRTIIIHFSFHYVFNRSETCVARGSGAEVVLAQTPNNSDDTLLALHCAGAHLYLFLRLYVGSQGQQAMSNINLRNGL